MARTKRARKAVTLPYVGDHGTGTKAATYGTVLEVVRDESGKPNPNNLGRRRRTSEIDRLAPRLSMRQEQAARAISDAYCRVQSLSSGGPLKEHVDSSPKPDATIAVQIDAQSHLSYVMKKVPSSPPECRAAIEQVCWHGEPISHLDRVKRNGWHMTCLKAALDVVADHLRY